MATASEISYIAQFLNDREPEELGAWDDRTGMWDEAATTFDGDIIVPIPLLTINSGYLRYIRHYLNDDPNQEGLGIQWDQNPNQFDQETLTWDEV